MDTNDFNRYALGVFKTIYLFLLMNNLRKTADIFKIESDLNNEMLEKVCSKSLLLKRCKCSKNKGNQTESGKLLDHNREALEGTVEGGPLQYKTDDTVVFYICEHFSQNEEKSVGCRKEEFESAEPKLRKDAQVEIGGSKSEIFKLRSKFSQLQQEHQKLIAVTSELTTALQMNIVGQTKNMNSTLEQCKTIYPSLFTAITPRELMEKQINHCQIGTDSPINIEETILEENDRKVDRWTNSDTKQESREVEVIEHINVQHLSPASPIKTPLTPETVRQVLETVFTRIFDAVRCDDYETVKTETGLNPRQMEKIVDEVLENMSKSPNNCGAGEGKLARPISAKDHMDDIRENVFNIDYRKIKTDLLDGDKERKIRILQALRWRITKAENHIRDRVMTTYIQNDILDLQSKISIPERMLCGYTDNCIQESICRLINTLASLRQGRDYLTMDERLLKNVLIKKTKDIKNMSSAVIRNMLIASVQKLSIRKQCRIRMVSEGLFEVLIDYLDEFYDKLSRYCLEYCSALLMNLCLVDEAKAIATKMSEKVIELIKRFVLSENECCLPYINGMMFSLLEREEIVEEAKRQELDKVLMRFIRTTTNENIRKQLDFIMQSRLFGKSEPLNDNDDENKDEVDLLEIELDQDDFITHLPSGEKLLEEYQMEISSDVDKNQYASSKNDYPPNSAQSFSEDNKVFFYKPSPERGIFEGNKPRRLTTFSQVPLENVIRNKRVSLKTGKFPATPICYMENCQKLQEENASCSCTKCVQPQNRYTCGCYELIRREVSEVENKLGLNEQNFGKNISNSEFMNSKSRNRNLSTNTSTTTTTANNNNNNDNNIKASEENKNETDLNGEINNENVQSIDSTLDCKDNKDGRKKSSCKVCGEKKCECAFESRPKICRTPPL